MAYRVAGTGRVCSLGEITVAFYEAGGNVAFYEAGATLEQVRTWVVTAYPADAPAPLPPRPLRLRRRLRPRSSLTSPTGS